MIRKILYWLPYLPIIGFFAGAILWMEYETCIDDDAHVIPSAFVQAVSILATPIIIALNTYP